MLRALADESMPWADPIETSHLRESLVAAA
jgi:hypothetical protein